MAQLNLYIPDKIEKEIRKQAHTKGESISSYLGNLIKGNFPQEAWPADFFKTLVGSLSEDFPDEIPRQLPTEIEIL